MMAYLRRSNLARRSTFLATLALAVGLTACGGGGTDTASTEGSGATQSVPLDGTVSLSGAGASFPAPIYQAWFIELNKKVPDLQVDYQSVGSGAGVRNFLERTVDFGASDVAMTDEELAQIEGGAILLPMTAGSIVLAYNLPGIESGLQLPRDVYVDILLGEITNWNDPRITEANPDLDLPDRPITVVHRSDGSGTTGVFTKHLSTISSDWQTKIGEGKTVEWPGKGTFIGGKGNEGVTAQIQQNEGAIGYVEYGYATNNNLAVAALENSAGNFVLPSDESAAATLATEELPDNLRLFITDPQGEDAYPVVTYTWLLVYQQYDDPQKAIAVEAAIEYGLNEGQQAAPALGYVALPPNVRERVAEAADGISPDYDITVE